MRERTGDMLQRASSYAPSQGVPDACFSERYEAVRDLEQYLGDPNDPTRPFSFSRSLACDEKDVYPQSAENAIRGWGAAEYLIPAALGGKLGDMEQALAVLRTIARRDVTVAVSFGANLLAALPVWIAGTDQQRQFVKCILREGSHLSLAATERGHGSDLLATQTRVDRDASAFA